MRIRPVIRAVWPLTAWAGAGAVIAVAVFAATQTGAGQAAIGWLLRFLLFYAGVFALVASTATVGAGLIAADRMLLRPVHRLAAQLVHRGTAVLTIVFLVTHVALEIAAGRARPVDAVVPFLAPGRTFYIGLGTVAFDLFVIIAATGLWRGWFARSHTAARTWRAIHVVAYIAWPLAIAHGLLAGRAAKPYVIMSYCACLAAVAASLAVRLLIDADARRLPWRAGPQRADPQRAGAEQVVP